MFEFTALVALVVAVYGGAWVVERIGQLLASNPTALGWSESERSGAQLPLQVRATIYEPRSIDERRMADLLDPIPTSRNLYGLLPFESDDHDPLA